MSLQARKRTWHIMYFRVMGGVFQSRDIESCGRPGTGATPIPLSNLAHHLFSCDCNLGIKVFFRQLYFI